MEGGSRVLTQSIKQNGRVFQIDLEQLLQEDKLIQPFLEKDTSVYLEDFLTEGQIIAWRNRKQHAEEIVPINEMTRKEILNAVDRKRLDRAKNKQHRITVRYEGVTAQRGWIKFTTNSQYLPAIRYTQYIKLKEAKDMKYFKEFKQRDIIRLFMSGDLQVSCSCPDWRYRMKYQAWQMGYGLFKENRFPKIANPSLEGSVCKHLICVLSVMGLNWTSIARDMSKSKFFKRKAELDEYDKEQENKRLKTSKKGWKHKTT